MVHFNGCRQNSTHCFGVKDTSRIVVPERLIQEVLAVSHSGGLVGHMGQDRTWKSQEGQGQLLMEEHEARCG